MGLESVKKVAEADFPTRWGVFRILGFEGVRTQDSQIDSQSGCGQAGTVEGLVALVMGDVQAAPPLVRIHSQCLTGDVFGIADPAIAGCNWSLRCAKSLPRALGSALRSNRKAAALG